MPFFKMKADILKIDDKANKKLDSFLLKEYRQAARAFVREAVQHIPVDTGMARGTFLHLGRLLKVAVKINPKRNRDILSRGRVYSIDYERTPPKYWHRPARGEFKTPELGAELAIVNDQPSSAFNKADDLFKQIGAKIEFKLTSKTFHLTLNDLEGSVGTGPWQAFQKAEAVMFNQLSTMHKRLPGIAKFVLKSRISVGSSGAVSQSNFEPITRQQTIRDED